MLLTAGRCLWINERSVPRLYLSVSLSRLLLLHFRLENTRYLLLDGAQTTHFPLLCLKSVTWIGAYDEAEGERAETTTAKRRGRRFRLSFWSRDKLLPPALKRSFEHSYSFVFHYYYCYFIIVPLLIIVLIKYLYFKLRVYQFNMSALYNNSCLKIRQIARCIWLLLPLMFTFGLQSDYNKQRPTCYNSHFKLLWVEKSRTKRTTPKKYIFVRKEQKWKQNNKKLKYKNVKQNRTETCLRQCLSKKNI